MIEAALVLFAVALVGQLAHAFVVQRALRSAWAETTYHRDQAEFWARGVDSLTDELEMLRREPHTETVLPDNDLFDEAAE